jgi:transposase
VNQCKYRVYIPERSIKKLYLAGMNIRDLAKKYYVSYCAMRRRLLDMGVLRKKKTKKLSRKELNWKYHVEKKSLKAIAEQCKCGTRKIKRLMHDNNLKRRSPGGNRNKRINYATPKAIEFLKQKGLKPKEIASRCGTSIRYVYYQMKNEPKEVKQ